MSTLRAARAVAVIVVATALAARCASAAETDSTAALRGDTLAHVVLLPPVEVSTARATGITPQYDEDIDKWSSIALPANFR